MHDEVWFDSSRLGALLYRCCLLILDEATSSVDTQPTAARVCKPRRSLSLLASQAVSGASLSGRARCVGYLLGYSSCWAMGRASRVPAITTPV
jgi:hypothetical protein